MRFLFMVSAWLLALCELQAAPPIEAYGALPKIDAVTLSPDGRHVAYLASLEGEPHLIVYELDKGPLGAFKTDDVKARYVRFAGPDYVVLNASDTRKVFGYRGRLELSGAFSYSLKKGKIRQIPSPHADLYPAQEGLGRIVGLARDNEHVFMPAFTGQGQRPPYDLIKVNLENGRVRTERGGRSTTIDWVTDENGVVLVREDYNNKSDQYELHTEISGGFTSFFERETPGIPFSIVGVKPDMSGLVIVDEQEGKDFSTVHTLYFDGTFSEPIFAREDAGVERVVTDINRVVLGVEYAGFLPTYEFYDADLQTQMNALQNYFSESAVYLQSWSKDLSKLLLYVEGAETAGTFYIFDRPAKLATKIADARPQLEPADVAPVQIIKYKARDGLSIPALLTLPLGRPVENAPMIVMPHGGPESHDRYGFDWMAQYFASRGYLVFQPNFRGSDGFGVSFRLAGRGEWGGKMQDDITDGVRALISTGRADPERICIVGASYGGYAALAGGAFTPELYKCVAAIAPVTDLPRMLKEERRDHGSRHWVYAHWQDLIGDAKDERDKLEAISPVNHAAAFQAPVLLIHGKDDLIVPIDQSRAMERALERAGKEVSLVALKGEDHWLSTGGTRLETLKLLDAFVKEHIGQQQQATGSARSITQ